MTPRVRKVLAYGGYPLFYIVALVVFIDLTFPNAALARFIESEFNSRQVFGSGVKLDVEAASLYWMSGVELEGVRLKKPESAADKDTPATSAAASSPDADKGKAKPPASPAPDTGVIEQAHVSVSLLRLLFGTEKLSFGANAFGGDVDGVFVNSDDERTVELEIQEVGVTDMPLLADTVGLPLAGSLTGTVDLTMPEQKASKAEGKIEFAIDALTAGDGKAKILNTIALPKVNAGRVVFEADVKEGVLTIKKLEAKGKDLELSAEGKIQLRDRIESSIMDVSLKFRFSDAYKNKNDMTRGLFGDPTSGTPGLLELDPKVRRSKRDDGYYAWVGRGILGKPTFSPASSSTSKSTTTRRIPRRR